MKPTNFDDSMTMFDEKEEEDDEYTWVTFNGHSQKISPEELKSILDAHPTVMTPEKFYEWKEKKETEFATWYDKKLDEALLLGFDTDRYMDMYIDDVDEETMRAINFEDYANYLEVSLYGVKSTV